jgi:hypothetical protein
MGVDSQNFQVTNQREDIEGLLQEIKKLGFEQSELDALRTAVLEDRSKGKTPDVMEGETGKWFAKAEGCRQRSGESGRRICVECHCWPQEVKMGHQEIAGVLRDSVVLCGAFGVDLQRTSREQGC